MSPFCYPVAGNATSRPVPFPHCTSARRMKRFRSAPCGLLIGLAVAFGRLAHAGCNHPVTAAYTTALAAEMLGSQPESGIPSMTDEIAALSGCPISVITAPTARVWAMFNRGELDLVLGATQTDERDQVADFIPTIRFPVVLVTMRPPGSIPDHLEQFASHRLRVGLLRGVRLSADAQAVVEDLRRQGLIDEATDREEAYRKLEGGRDDALVATVVPTDRPEHDTLRVIVQRQFTPVVNGTYLRKSPFTPEEQQLLHDAIAKATDDRELTVHLK